LSDPERAGPKGDGEQRDEGETGQGTGVPPQRSRRTSKSEVASHVFSQFFFRAEPVERFDITRLSQ
jgi:hypothetical protein